MTRRSTATRQSDWYYEISGFTGTWASGSAASLKGQDTKVADGGGPEESLPGDPSWDAQTFSRPFKRDRDFLTLRDAKERYGEEVTITGFCKTKDGVVGDTITILGKISGLTGPSGDRMSSSPANLELSVTVDDVIF